MRPSLLALLLIACTGTLGGGSDDVSTETTTDSITTCPGVRKVAFDKINTSCLIDRFTIEVDFTRLRSKDCVGYITSAQRTTSDAGTPALCERVVDLTCGGIGQVHGGLTVTHEGELTGVVQVVDLGTRCAALFRASFLSEPESQKAMTGGEP